MDEFEQGLLEEIENYPHSKKESQSDFEKGLFEALKSPTAPASPFEKPADSDFEASLADVITESKKPPRKRAVVIEQTPGLVVTLAVRKPNMITDHRFEYKSNQISRLLAKIEAEKAARDAGYPIVGFVIDIK